MHWLLFLSQLPAHPSSMRVMVWRKMRNAGALGLQNGAWLLPDESSQASFLEGLMSAIQNQGASAQIFKAVPYAEDTEKNNIESFRAERDEEYTEFCERTREFLGEIAKETEKEKFTFAELEELEQDMQRLDSWLEKIQRRDFFNGHRKREAEQILEQAAAAFQPFSSQVYARQGIDLAQESETREDGKRQKK